MHQGHIRLWRKIRDWPYYTDGPVLQVFIELLLTANHKTKYWRGIEVKRGQVLTGMDSLANLTGLTYKQVRRALTLLEQGREITRFRAAKYSIITVCKYNEYQTPKERAGQSEGSQQGSQRAGRGQQLKNDKNDNKKSGGQFKPPTIEEVRSYFSDKGINNGEADKFWNHHDANNWYRGKTKMQRWKSAASYWISNIDDFRPRGNYGKGQTPHDYI